MIERGKKMKKLLSLFCIISNLSLANSLDKDSIIFPTVQNRKESIQNFNKQEEILKFILEHNSVQGNEIYEKVMYYSHMYNIDPAVIISIIKRESNFKTEAKSNAGAIGLMQLMPGTASSMGVKNPWDIGENILGGIKYFKQCLEKNKENLPLALASYNAGIGAVLKYGGIPPYEETKNYVNLVLKTLEKFQIKYTYDEVEFEKAVKGIFSEISFENADFGEI